MGPVATRVLLIGRPVVIRDRQHQLATGSQTGFQLTQDVRHGFRPEVLQRIAADHPLIAVSIQWQVTHVRNNIGFRLPAEDRILLASVKVQCAESFQVRRIIGTCNV